MLTQMRLHLGSTSDTLWFHRASIRLLRPPWYDELNVMSACYTAITDNRFVLTLISVHVNFF